MAETGIGEQLPTHRSFDEQFHPIVHNRPEGSFASYRTTPENPLGNTIVYAFGWTAKANEHTKHFFKAFFDRHRDVLSAQPPTYPPGETPPDSIYNAFALRNADATVQAIEEAGLEKVDLVGDSEGSSVILTVANRLKEKGDVKVGNIVLVSPAGFGSPTFPELAKGIAKMLGQEAVRFVRLPRSRRNIIRMLNPKPFFEQDPRQLIKEGQDVSNAQMVKLMQGIGDYADSITVLHSNDDPVVGIDAINTDVQYILQEKRRAFEASLREEVKAGTVTPDEADRKREANRKEEEHNPLIASANKAGHIYFEYGQEVNIPIVCEILNWQDSRNMSNQDKDVA